MTRLVVLSYDGSESSRHAITEAGALLAGGPAVVLHVYQSLLAYAPGYPLAGFSGGLEVSAAELDAEGSKRAKQIAEEGAAAARAAGFDAQGRAELAEARVWEEIVRVAGELDAGLVVLGTRGLTGVKSALLGSVSNGVVHHCPRPVMVVPASEEN